MIGLDCGVMAITHIYTIIQPLNIASLILWYTTFYISIQYSMSAPITKKAAGMLLIY